MSKTDRNHKNPQDYEALTFKAQAAKIMHIKHGLPFRVIAKQLHISVYTIQRWSDAEKWQELRPDINRDKKATERKQAAILFIKHGLTASAISEKLNVSMQTLKKWKDAGNWQELRPDFQILSEYKAAGMYIEKGMSVSDICQLLNVSELTVNIWIYKNGWNAARLVSQAQNVTVEIVEDFCSYFKKYFPDDAAKVEVMQNGYNKSITSKHLNP